jgi:hypothetical protein
MGLRRVGHVFLEKIRCTRRPAYSYLCTRRPYSYPCTCIRRPVKFKFQKSPPSSHQINTCTRRPVNPPEKNSKKKSCTRTYLPMPVYPHTRTRTRDGHGYETGRVLFWTKYQADHNQMTAIIITNIVKNRLRENLNFFVKEASDLIRQMFSTVESSYNKI